MKRALVLTPMANVDHSGEIVLTPQLAVSYTGHVTDVSNLPPGQMPTDPNMILVEFTTEDAVMAAVQADPVFLVFEPETIDA